jgi:hypothetical protein
VRTKPNFGKADQMGSGPAGLEAGGCGQMFLMIVGGYYVISAIVNVTSDGGSTLDQFICYGALFGLVVLVILGVRDWFRENLAVEAEKEKWRKSCTSAEVAIVSRRHYPGGSTDDGYDIHFFRAYHRLTLEMNADQKAAATNQTVLEVDVDGIVYEKLEKRQTVRIYYQPEVPLTFLLEEEF